MIISSIRPPIEKPTKKNPKKVKIKHSFSQKNATSIKSSATGLLSESTSL
jgi:hypothetical protein